MKRLLLLVFCVFFSWQLVNVASMAPKNVNGPKIAVVLTGDQNMFTEKKITEGIQKEIKKKFPEGKYQVIEDKKVYQDLLILVEERNDTDVVAIDQLKQNDFVAVGQKHGYDYVMVLPFYNNGGYYNTSGWTNMVSQNITLRARIVDVNKGAYLYRLDVTEQGETGNAFGAPSLVRAQREAIKKCLETVFADLEIGEKTTKKK